MPWTASVPATIRPACGHTHIGETGRYSVFNRVGPLFYICTRSVSSSATEGGEGQWGRGGDGGSWCNFFNPLQYKNTKSHFLFRHSDILQMSGCLSVPVVMGPPKGHLAVLLLHLHLPFVLLKLRALFSVNGNTENTFQSMEEENFRVEFASTGR